jgi:hypothetical protein
LVDGRRTQNGDSRYRRFSQLTRQGKLQQARAERPDLRPGNLDDDRSGCGDEVFVISPRIVIIAVASKKYVGELAKWVKIFGGVRFGAINWFRTRGNFYDLK